jgi:hypothetical protein
MHGQLDMGYQPKVAPISDLVWVNLAPASEKKLVELKLSIWPRKCHSSKKSIWFKCAYRIRWYSQLYDYIDRWYTKSEYIKLRLMA